MGFALANVTGPSEYELRWNTSPPQFGDSLVAPTGFNYRITVTDIYSGCVEEATAEIPRFPYVRAAFTANPSTECVLITDLSSAFLTKVQEVLKAYGTMGDGKRRNLYSRDLTSTYL